MADGKREFPRKRTLLSATAFFNDGQFSLPCKVRDISESGLRLNISDAIVLPDRFAVHIPSQDIIHDVCLKWRRASDAGVALSGQQADNPWDRVPRPGSDRTSALEAEILRLNHIVARISKERDDLRRLLRQSAKHATAEHGAATASLRSHVGSDGRDVQDYDVYDDMNDEWTTSSGALSTAAMNNFENY